MQRLLLLVSFLITMESASAQQPPTIVEAEALLARAIPVPGLTLERYLESRSAEFVMLDFDGDGAVTAADIDLHHAALAADQRAGHIAQILSADLDGNGIVTRAEVRELVGGFLLQFMPPGQKPEVEARLREQIEAEVTKRMSADLNGDGRIDGAECWQLPRLQ